MIWFDKSFIKFCKSFINLIKLVSTLICSSARVKRVDGILVRAHNKLSEAEKLLYLSQNIFLFAMFQSSSSCSHEATNIAHMKQQKFCS